MALVAVAMDKNDLRRAVGVILIAALGAYACDKPSQDGGAEPQPRAETPQVSPEPKVVAESGSSPEGKAAAPQTEQGAKRIARTWLLALKAGDSNALKSATTFPFQLFEPGEYPGCEREDAKDDAQLSAALRCLLTDDLLQEELVAQPQPVMKTSSADGLPDWVQPREPSGQATFVRVFLPADGVSYELILAIKAGGVAKVLKRATFDGD